MAISLTEMQQLRDDAVRNKSAGLVNVRFSDGRQLQYVATVSDWQKIIADLDGMINAVSSQPAPRFSLSTFSRD